MLGAIARAERAPLGEPELDVLTWITQEWFDQGSSIDGRVRFTLYVLGTDLYGGGRSGWTPSGRYRELMREAIDNLHAVVVTLRSISVLTGERERRCVPRCTSSRPWSTTSRFSCSAMRGRAMPPPSAPCAPIPSRSRSLTGCVPAPLRAGGVGLATQRKLAGAAKRLWYELSARAGDFTSSPFPSQVELVVPLTVEFYAAMNLQAARERDNRAALAAAANRVVAADATYLTIDIVRGDDGYLLRAVRCDDGPSAVIEGAAVDLRV